MTTQDSPGRAGPRPTSVSPKAKSARWFWCLVLAWRIPRLDRVPQGLGFLTCMCAVKVLPSHVSMLSPGSMTLTELGTRYTHTH